MVKITGKGKQKVKSKVLNADQKKGAKLRNTDLKHDPKPIPYHDTTEIWREIMAEIWRFISKGPAHVFQTFENDKTLLNLLIAKGDFFRKVTRTIRSGYNHVRPLFDKEGNPIVGYVPQKRYTYIPDNMVEWSVDDLIKLIEYGFIYTPRMFHLDSHPSGVLLNFARRLSNEEKMEIVYPTQGYYQYAICPKKHVYERVLRELGLPTTGNKAQLQKRLLQFLGASKPVSLVDRVVEDAKKSGVDLDSNALSQCGCNRLHNWYRVQFKLKYSNAGAFAAKTKELILKDVCSFNLQPAKKKSSYEALEDVLSKKKDVSKHAFQQIIDAGFVGEEILFGAEDHRYANPECGIITNITPTQITYRPYGKKEVTNESETIKVCSNLLTGEGMIEKSVTVRKQYWDKKNLGQPKVYKKSYATKGRFLSFKLRAKTNNKTKFSNGYKAMSLLRLKWQPDPRNDIRGGCWCYEYEILSGSIKTKGGWVYDPNYESRFDYLTLNRKQF
jgi:hypothetical protein